jgi:hypothetical protein
MTKAKATAIGEVPCPVSECNLVIPVFKFRAKNADPKFTRFGGKWYCRCPEHGTFGFDGARGIQEHIANKGKIWGDQQPGAAAAADAQENGKAAAPVSSSKQPAAKPTSRPAPAATAAATAKPRVKLFGWSNRS